MFLLQLILFIIECISFCYLFYKILEINKDIETLYNNYSKELENITKSNVARKRGVLK